MQADFGLLHDRLCDDPGVGRTSMTINVEHGDAARDEDEMLRVTEATFTVVALDPNGRSRLIPVCGPAQAPPKDR